MKVVFAILLMIFPLSPAFAWLNSAAFSVCVLDEDGLPVSNAVVRAGFYQSKSVGRGAGIELAKRFVKLTDTNGVCSFQGRCNGTVVWGPEKDGYYSTLGIRVPLNKVSFGRFEPWNLQYEATLRKIINPVPMYAKRLWDEFIPAYGAPLGYDLMKGDWLPPHGRGETADFIFQLDCKFGGKRAIDNGQIFESTFTLTFSNDGDGIQEADDTQWPGSVFRLPRYAPEDGYASKWCEKGYENEQGSSVSSEKDYFFRVRTKKDDEGRIVSALYGKIRKSLHAVVVISGSKLRLAYYLNPTPNDRNMEFDPKRNLLTDLTPFEAVSEP